MRFDFTTHAWPRDRPILLLCGYRTGSTALCSAVSEITGSENFDEIWHPSLPQRHQHWKVKDFAGELWVGKVMSNQINSSMRDELISVLKRAHVVSLRRRDIHAQIVSLYLCLVTQKWHYARNSIQDSQQVCYEVILQESEMLNARHNILETNQKLENWLIHATQHLWYEDLDIKGGRFEHYHRPVNYQDVVQLLLDIESRDPQIPPQQ
jgi:LPS sulfotransferase NodH